MNHIPFYLKLNYTIPTKNLAIKLTIKNIYLLFIEIQFVEINIPSPTPYNNIPFKINFFLAPFLSKYFPDIKDPNNHPIGNILNIIPINEVGKFL